jgi:hypothetical protein
LKPGAFKLWVNWIGPVQPNLAERLGQLISAAPLARDVALQVEFERQTLKPVFHLIGVRLWVWKVIGYGSWVNFIQPAGPHREEAVVPRVEDRADGGVAHIQQHNVARVQ